VLTAPTAEYESISGAEKFVRCAFRKKSRNIATQSQGNSGKVLLSRMAADPKLELIEPILIEAGVAEVPVPLTLLARHVRLEGAALCEMLHASRLNEFIWWPEASAEMFRTVAFRGRWLAERLWQAEKITPAGTSHYPHLIALLDEANPTLLLERYFFLNLLMALHNQAKLTQVERLLRDYYERFHGAESLAGPQERQAWGFFHPTHLQSIFHT
jgi:hypothetical protein